jgi:hypothetical protein
LTEQRKALAVKIGLVKPVGDEDWDSFLALLEGLIPIIEEFMAMCA